MSGIQVHVRVRPDPESVWATADTVIYNSNRQDARFVYNRVHGSAATNETIFHGLEPCVHAAFDGKNVTVMAYGQTGSGKTHSMTGSQGDPGIIHRAARLLVDLASSSADASLQVSFVEIYNEQVRDLMAPERGEVALRDAPDNGITLDRCGQPVATYESFARLCVQAENSRKYGVTDMNEHSSRSHVIIYIEITRPGKPKSTLSLVDLAGSESASRANTEGQLLREGGFINRSLLTLGNVVDAVIENRSHIPYRESKLTRILRNCLGGAGLTFIICCVNPQRANVDQTISSLRFAHRAMKIKTDPTVTVSGMPLLIQQHLEWITEKRANAEEMQQMSYEEGVRGAFLANRDNIRTIGERVSAEAEASKAAFERLGRILMFRERRLAIQRIVEAETDVDRTEHQEKENTAIDASTTKRCRGAENSASSLKQKRKRLETTLASETSDGNHQRQLKQAAFEAGHRGQTTAAAAIMAEETQQRQHLLIQHARDVARIRKLFTLPTEEQFSTEALTGQESSLADARSALSELDVAFSMVKDEEPFPTSFGTEAQPPAPSEEDIGGLKEQEHQLRTEQASRHRVPSVQPTASANWPDRLSSARVLLSSVRERLTMAGGLSKTNATHQRQSLSAPATMKSATAQRAIEKARRNNTPSPSAN